MDSETRRIVGLVRSGTNNIRLIFRLVKTTMHLPFGFLNDLKETNDRRASLSMS